MVATVAQREAFNEASRDLALALGQTVMRRGDVIYVPSRTRRGVHHKVLIGPTGATSCTCRGWEQFGHCWASTQVKEFYMTTETGTALVPIKPIPPKSILPSKQELNIIGTIAKTAVMARGHAVPASIDSAAKAAAVMLAGHELGIKPMTALRHIFVVNGRTEPDAQIMAGIVQSAEQDAVIEIVDLEFQGGDKPSGKCTMRLSRPSRGPNARWEYTYEYADAQRAGLTSKAGPWQQFPKDMMRWAATKRLCRVYAADLINSVGSVEVTAVRDLLASAEEESEEMVDTKQLAQESLYNPGDDPEEEAPEPTEDNPENDEPPLSLEDARKAITELLTVLNGTPAYLKLYKDLSRFMPDGKAAFNPEGLLEADTANECLRAIQKVIGERAT